MQKLITAKTAEIRQQIRYRRQTLSEKQRNQEQNTIYQKIAQHDRLSSAHNIGIFISFDGELNTRPIIEHLWQQNKAVFVPIIHPFNQNYLLFLRYQTNTQLSRNKFGIWQPQLNVNDVIPFHQLDIVFTPLVAFDDRNYRIGMGGGYYDRMLGQFAENPPYSIGLAFKCQKIPHVNNQPWDIKLPEIISG